MITFQAQEIKFKLSQKTTYKAWIKSIILLYNHKQGAINYIFCSDDYLLQINKKHLNHDTYTDIITFDYSKAGKQKKNQWRNFNKH